MVSEVVPSVMAIANAAPSVVYCCVEFDEVLRPVCRMGEPAVEELGANAC
jgi:hypothetical protein